MSSLLGTSDRAERLASLERVQRPCTGGRSARGHRHQPRVLEGHRTGQPSPLHHEASELPRIRSVHVKHREIGILYSHSILSISSSSHRTTPRATTPYTSSRFPSSGKRNQWCWRRVLWMSSLRHRRLVVAHRGLSRGATSAPHFPASSHGLSPMPTSSSRPLLVRTSPRLTGMGGRSSSCEFRCGSTQTSPFRTVRQPGTSRGSLVTNSCGRWLRQVPRPV